jgi:outer membrane protein
MKTSTHNTLRLCLALLLSSQIVQAVEQSLLADKLEIGPGISSRQSVYVDQGTFTQLVPIVVAKYENFYAEGDKAAWIFHDFKVGEINFWTETVALYRQQGIIDAKGTLSDLSDRKDAIEMGLALGVASESFGIVNISLAYDVIETHKGSALTLNYEVPLVFGDWIIRPVFAVESVSKNLANYYFSVDSSEVVAGRPAYSISKATNYSWGYDMKYIIDDDWRITHSVEFTKLDDTIAQSPLVEHSTNIQLSIAVVYDFF